MLLVCEDHHLPTLQHLLVAEITIMLISARTTNINIIVELSFIPP